ncbi:MAG: tetratricopeptide repeat protein [Burkholderiales bacterium]|nr:tetratricopeptide repeat protein [Burkholderiales bacterium]
MKSALESLRQAIELQPADTALLANMVRLCSQAGRPQDAVPVLQQAIAAQPDSADAHHWLGLMLRASGRPREAAASLAEAVRLQPDHAEAHNARGVTLAELGDRHGAVASFDQSLRLWPDVADTHRNRGLALRQLGDAERAVASFDEAIRLEPGQALSHHQRALALRDLKRPAEALASLERAVALAPNLADAHYMRGVFLLELARADEALASLDRALQLKPDAADAWNLRGVALRLLGRIEASLASFDAALQRKPVFAQAHLDRGYALRELGRLDEAIASYDRAIAADPHDVEATWGKAIALLLAGRLEEGFELFECRWDKASFTSPKRGFRAPQWTGQQPLAGKTIVLHAEQGFGDAIQFARFAPLVAERGGRVVLEVPRALAGLLGTLPGIVQVVERGRPLPPFDFHCPLMSLPRAFGTTLHSIPAAEGYLAPDPGKLAHWQAVLGPARAPRIGLAWSGRPTHKGDRQRSLGLARLVEALPSGPEYVSLQKELREPDDAVLAAHPGLRHFGARLVDFGDTAALCAAMDLVVSVDTSVAHLAGALGRPTWLLLPRAPDWRWLLDRPNTPWYASVRLFRQDAARDWDPVLSRIAGAIRDTLHLGV